MKLLEIQAAIGAAILLLSSPCDATGRRHHLKHLDMLEKRHSHKRIHASPKVEGIEGVELKKRATCAFPTDAGLVAVTPGSSNAGWAMSPDQSCKAGSWCPYACPPGEVMAQWNPDATSYTYPQSMDGGLYCDSNGKISKPFPNKPYCVSGTGTLGAKNNCGDVVSFCQTVLPGNEAMLIPTSVSSWAQLAVPGTSYWASTAAHYYINPPGVGTGDACIWSDGSKPVGNWAPYVAGANTDSNGNTFAKVAWNPIWTGSSLSGTKPKFGIKIECVGGGCNGTPCSINPATDGIGGVTSADQASGAGGASFCVVTVPKGSTANIVVFNTDGSSLASLDSNNAASGSSKDSSSDKATPTPSPSPSPTPTPTPTPTPSSTIAASSSAAASSAAVSSTVLSSPTISLLPSGTNTTSSYPTAENSPHILFEKNSTITSASGSGGANPTGVTVIGGSTVGASPIASATKKSGASEISAGTGSIFSLVIMLAFAGFIL